MSVLRGNFKSFVSTIWHFFSVLLSDHMTRISESIHERILIGVWLLMAGNVLLNTFSGCLWGFMIKKIPIQKIDSWNDLYENFKDMRMLCNRFYPISDFAEHVESDMAQDFKKRMEIIEWIEMLNPKKTRRSDRENIFGSTRFCF